MQTLRVRQIRYDPYWNIGNLILPFEPDHEDNSSKQFFKSSSFPFTPYDSSVYNKLLCQTLSNALDISWQCPLTSTLAVQWNHKFISCTTESNRAMHEPRGKKPGWHFVKSSFLIKWLNRSLKLNRSTF